LPDRQETTFFKRMFLSIRVDFSLLETDFCEKNRPQAKFSVYYLSQNPLPQMDDFVWHEQCMSVSGSATAVKIDSILLMQQRFSEIISNTTRHQGLEAMCRRTFLT